MRFIDVAILSVIQGITEFLPISSSGHLVLAQTYLGLEDVPVLFIWGPLVQRFSSTTVSLAIFCETSVYG